jgi:hypothetical protein
MMWHNGIIWGADIPTAQRNTSINVLQNYSLMKTRVNNMKVIKMKPL